MRPRATFYQFRDNTSHTRGFTCAISILPRSEMMTRTCPEFGAVESYPSGAFDVVVEGGSKYPDVLRCGAYPFLIVSERVVDVWHKANLMCFHELEVKVAEVKSSRLRHVVPPNYFKIEIDGQCSIDLAASGVKIVHFCREHRYLVTRPSLVLEFRMVPGSWDGCNLLRDPVLYPRINFCTHVILDLARQHKFTNFRFDFMYGPVDLQGKGIKY